MSSLHSSWSHILALTRSFLCLDVSPDLLNACMPQAPQTQPAPSCPCQPRSLSCIALRKCLCCPLRCQAKTWGASLSLILLSKKSPSPTSSVFKVHIIKWCAPGNRSISSVRPGSPAPLAFRRGGTPLTLEKPCVDPWKESSLRLYSLHSLTNTVLGSEQLLRKCLSSCNGPAWL